MLSRESVTWRSAVTLKDFQLGKEQEALQKRKGSRIKDIMKAHEKVTCGECIGLVRQSRGFDVAQIRLFCVFTSPCSEE